MIESSTLLELEKQHGLPSGLLQSVMMAESAGNPNAVSPKGAQGLFQFMPQTAKAYGINPLDPQQAAVGAARMYGDLSKQFGGDVPSMLAAYNWGSGNLTKKGMENAPKETRDYINKVQSGMGKQYAQADTGNMTDASSVIDVEMPDGTIIEDVPVGTPKEVIMAKYNKTQPKQDVPVQLTPDTGMGRTVLDQGLQGATFGFGDEITNRIGAGIASLVTGENYSDLLNEASGMSKERLAAQFEENPVTSIASNIGGGLLTAGGASSALAKYAPKASGALQSFAGASPYKAAAGIGAGTGALYGAGTSDKPLAESGTDALIGGLTGAGAGMAGTYVGRNVIAPLINKAIEKTPLSTFADKFGRKTLNTKSKNAVAAQQSPFATPNVTEETFAPELIKPKGEYFSKTGGQRTQSPDLQRLESNARAGLLNTEAESAIRGADVKQNREFISFVDKLAGKMDDTTDINSLVEGIGSTIKSKAATQKAVVNSAYDLAKEGKGVKIGIDDIRKGLWRGIVDAKKEGAYDLTQMPKASSVIKRLADYSKKSGISKVTSVKLGEMENFRKQITNATNSSQDPTERKFLGEMLRNYDNFMEKTASEAVDIGDANAINAFKKAVSSRREYGKLFESNKLVEDIVTGGKSVDDTVQTLIGTGSIKGKKQMADNLNAIVKAADADIPAQNPIKLDSRKIPWGKTDNVSDSDEYMVMVDKINETADYISDTIEGEFRKLGLNKNFTINSTSSKQSASRYIEIIDDNTGEYISRIRLSDHATPDSAAPVDISFNIKQDTKDDILRYINEEIQNKIWPKASEYLPKNTGQGDVVKSDLRQAFMKKVFDKSTLGTEPNNPNVARVSPAKLKTELENLFVNQSEFSKNLYGKEAHKAALQAIKELELISTTQANVKNPSGSGELVGRLLKVMNKVPVVGRASGIASNIAESSTKYKGSQEVIKGLDEFGESLKKPMQSTFWAIEAPVAGVAAKESGSDREPMRLTITPKDKK